MIQELQATMADDVGPFRTHTKLERALATIREMTAALGERPIGDGSAFDLRRVGWFDLRNRLLVARRAAIAAPPRPQNPAGPQRREFPRPPPPWRGRQRGRP